MVKNKKRNNIKRDKSSHNSKRKRFNPWFAGAIFSIAASLGVASYYFLNKNEPSINERVQISFEQAKNTADLRQSYLNQLFKKKDSVGVEGWDSFASFVYDPNFSELTKLQIRKGGNNASRINEYSPENGLIRLISTPYFGERNVPLSSYFDKAAFKFCQTEDELLSCLDNESFHAHIFHTGKAHISTELPDKDSSPQLIFDLMSELYSFEKQFFFIELGKRKVRREFIEMFLLPANKLYQKLLIIAEQNDREGAFAKFIKQALESRPTIQYFTGEKVFFEDAIKDENLRQKYLEQRSKHLIQALESQYSTKLVDKIFYDPEYKGLDLLINKELADASSLEEVNYWKNSLVQNEDHRSQKDIKCLGKTMILPKKFMQGQPSDLYFSRDCFDPEFVDSEEEFLSLLDHELNHALIINKGLPIKKEFSAKHNLDSSMKLDLGSDLNSSCIEVVAYHFQILLIEDGVRKVRDSYRQRAVNSYYREYEIVRAIADRNDDSVESRFANALLDSLIYHPEPKRN